VALIYSMRLSLMKGAHATLSSTARQEIGVKPYFGLSRIMALDVPLPVCHARPKDKTTKQAAENSARDRKAAPQGAKAHRGHPKT
jgi:hypothetical protein